MARLEGRGGRNSTSRARAAADGRRRRDAAQVVACLRRLFQAIHRHSKAIQAAVGLSAPQVWALRILAAQPGLSLGELAERMYAHPSTVSGVVERLVARRAVRRAVDRHDRRGVELSLTPTGLKMARSSPLPFQENLRQALESMPAARLQHLRQSLQQIARVTDTERLDAPFFDVDGERDRRRVGAARRPPSAR
jgi:DNA-binding MarR family transcriptional regulator